MQFIYRLVGSNAVDKPVRVDTQLFPEMIPYLKDGERLFLVPTDELEAHAVLLRTTNAVVHVGVSDEGMTQLPPEFRNLLAQIAQ